MTKRREFPRSIKLAVIRRATRDGQTWCEKCGLPTKRWQIDHVIADSIGGEPILSNAELLCDVCYGVKNPQDTRVAAKTKRQADNHLGINTPTQRPLQSRGFPKSPKPKREGKPTLAPRRIYE